MLSQIKLPFDQKNGAGVDRTPANRDGMGPSRASLIGVDYALLRRAPLSVGSLSRQRPWRLRLIGLFMLGWVVALMFPICSALRLARFNTALLSDTPPPAWTGSYFTGVPAPAGALLALVPLVLSFEIDASWPRHPLLVGVVLVAVGGLMVSTLPTFSFKKGRVPRHLVLPALLGAALVMGIVVSSPWIGLSLLGLVYVCLIPFSWLAYRRHARQDATRGEVVPLRAVEPGAPRD